MAPAPSIHFFSAMMEIQLPGASVATQGLVSSFGVSRMLFSVSMLERIRKENQRSVQIKLGDLLFPALLVQQFTEQGMSYGARFRGLDAEHAKYLAERVEQDQLTAGWSRRHTRVPVKLLKNEPHPKKASFSWAGNDEKFQVLGFTLDGIRLVTAGELDSLKVGRTLRLEVSDNAGKSIPGIEAEIRNFSILLDEKDQLATEVGLRFVENGSAAREAYQALVRSCVQALAKRAR